MVDRENLRSESNQIQHMFGKTIDVLKKEKERERINVYNFSLMAIISTITSSMEG